MLHNVESRLAGGCIVCECPILSWRRHYSSFKNNHSTLFRGKHKSNAFGINPSWAGHRGTFDSALLSVGDSSPHMHCVTRSHAFCVYYVMPTGLLIAKNAAIVGVQWSSPILLVILVCALCASRDIESIATCYIKSNPLGFHEKIMHGFWG